MLGGIPIAHLGADLAGVVGRIELRDAVDATAAGDKAGPEGIDRMAERSDGAQTGDNDATGSGWIHKRQERQTSGGSAGKPDERGRMQTLPRVAAAVTTKNLEGHPSVAAGGQPRFVILNEVKDPS